MKARSFVMGGGHIGAGYHGDKKSRADKYFFMTE